MSQRQSESPLNSDELNQLSKAELVLVVLTQQTLIEELGREIEKLKLSRDLDSKTSSKGSVAKTFKSTSILYQSNFLSSDFKERFNKFFLSYTIPIVDTFYLTFINGVHNFNASYCPPCCIKGLIS